MSAASAYPDASDDLGKAAIIVAHPGHELMVYHWMERHRPLYFCLTDGSGGAAASRLPSTTRLLENTGITAGSLYGRYSDKDIYRLLLDGRVDVFVALVRELAGALEAAGADRVAGDAAEGFNPAHDVCRFLIDGAVGLVCRRTGRVIRNYDFVLDAPPDTDPEPARADALRLPLDDAALERKMRAAQAYPEMRAEVEAFRPAGIRRGVSAPRGDAVGACALRDRRARLRTIRPEARPRGPVSRDHPLSSARLAGPGRDRGGSRMSRVGEHPAAHGLPGAVVEAAGDRVIEPDLAGVPLGGMASAGAGGLPTGAGCADAPAP